MNPIVGWGLALLTAALAWRQWGWQGLIAAVTLIVFWLLLQFNRTMRVMRNASSSPVGHVPSAVMLNAKLKAGMTLLQVVTLTRSLGRSVSTSPEVWAWQDDSGARVTVTMAGPKVAHWELTREPVSDA